MALERSSKRARRSLCLVVGIKVAEWQKSDGKAYRRLMLGEGMEVGEEAKDTEKRRGRTFRRRGMKGAEALAELRQGRSLSKADRLGCRVRCFTDGLVLGSREFVEKAFREKRERFGAKRETGALGLPVKEGGLFSLRDLQV